MNNVPKVNGMGRLVDELFSFKYYIRNFNCLLSTETYNADGTYARSGGNGNNGIIDGSVNSC